MTVAPVAGSGFNSAVILSANLPPGYYASFGSGTISGGSGSTSLTVTAPAGSIGNITVSVTGADANSALAHPASGGILTVQDFTFPLSPPAASQLLVAAGTTGSWTLNPAGINHFNQPIFLQQTQYNGDASGGCSLPLTFPHTVTPGQVAQISVTPPTGYPAGPYQCGITISGTTTESRISRTACW